MCAFDCVSQHACNVAKQQLHAINMPESWLFSSPYFFAENHANRMCVCVCVRLINAKVFLGHITYRVAGTQSNVLTQKSIFMFVTQNAELLYGVDIGSLALARRLANTQRLLRVWCEQKLQPHKVVKPNRTLYIQMRKCMLCGTSVSVQCELSGRCFAGTMMLTYVIG